MQGKVMSDPKAHTEGVVGIDVCKARLDIHILPANTVLQVDNNKKGHKRLLVALKGLAITRVIVEATGKFHRGIHRLLHEHGYAVVVVNPKRSRLFAQAIGELAKTDPVDARMLAEFGCVASLKATPPLPQTLENLREIMRTREALMADKVSFGNRLATVTLPKVAKLIRQQIAAIKEAIEALTVQALDCVASDTGLARRLLILDSIKGVGPVTALSLIANMPELGTLDAKAVGLLAGLAPIAHESGQRSNRRHIAGGRRNVRTGLYMAAQSAVRFNPDLKRFYTRLIDAGKLPKVAITAAMRKLVVLANTLLKDDRPWSLNKPIGEPLHA